MNDEIDIELNLGKELALKVHKMSKKELIAHFVINVLLVKVRDETIVSLGDENKVLKSKLGKAESYVEQGRSMVTAVMERWYEYDE